MTKRGKLIVITGTDSSGKQTHTANTLARLVREGIPCQSMGFPRYDTPTGRIVGESYLGKNSPSWFEEPHLVHPFIASLYYAADRFAAKLEIETILELGTNLILDRYVEDNLAHQGGKANPKDRGKIISFIYSLEYGLLELPRPDEVIFLHMPHQVGMELKRRTGETKDGHESNPEHLARAEETFLELAKRYNWAKISCAPDGTFNSLRTLEDIGKEVYKRVVEIFQKP